MLNQRGSLLIILAVIVLMVAIAGGAYYLGTIKNSPAAVNNSPAATPASSPEAKKTALEGTFEEILKADCLRVPLSSGSSTDLIELDKAPIRVNQSLISVKFIQPGKVYCVPTAVSGGSYFFIDLQDPDNNDYIYIYNANSKELGHGGPLNLGMHGHLIKDNGNLKVSMYISGGSGPSLITDIQVVLRGEKKMTLSNGDAVYANFSKIAIKANNSRVLNILNNYSKPSELNPGQKELAGDPNPEIKTKLFSDLNNLGPSEKAALDEIEKVLSAIEAK